MTTSWCNICLKNCKGFENNWMGIINIPTGLHVPFTQCAISCKLWHVSITVQKKIFKMTGAHKGPVIRKVTKLKKKKVWSKNKNWFFFTLLVVKINWVIEAVKGKPCITCDCIPRQITSALSSEAPFRCGHSKSSVERKKQLKK